LKGYLLGFGEFGCVKELEAFQLSGIIERKYEGEKLKLKSSCVEDGAYRYAIKSLREDLKTSERQNAMVDIFVEANVLSKLNHPNIVKLRGITGIPGQSTFSIIIDRLYETLSEKCELWSDIQKSEFFSRHILLFKKKKNQKVALSLLRNKLLALSDIARAMKFIHNKGIVFRDLKPDNIGFDFRGNAKLFDFGFAKVLHDSEKIAKDQYNATGMVGSRRFMAPEVVLCKSYGLSVDVYSFSIVMWEVLSLRRAYDGYSYEKHAMLVVTQGKRPKLKSRWSNEIKKMLLSCWCHDPKNREIFSAISKQLTEIVNQVHGHVLNRTDHLLSLSRSGNSKKIQSH
jgi:serine/threonine protein kinase